MDYGWTDGFDMAATVGGQASLLPSTELMLTHAQSGKFLIFVDDELEKEKREKEEKSERSEQRAATKRNDKAKREESEALAALSAATRRCDCITA